MRLRFWGVRGACAATEPEYLGVGGNTPCVELRGADDELVVLDAGIGLYWLGRSLMAGPLGRGKGEVTLLLSHTHWDHIQGVPFFVPAFIPGNRIRISGGELPHLEDALEGQMNPTYSPLGSISNMGADISVHRLAAGEDLRVGGLTIEHALLPNGDHTTTGFRIEEDGRSICYVAEVAHPAAGPADAVVRLARDADLLIHEAFYTGQELAQGGTSLAGPSAPPSSGHSSFAQATDAARAAGVGRLLFFYHHPDHTDATVDAAVAAERKRAGDTLRIDTAREGAELHV